MKLLRHIFRFFLTVLLPVVLFAAIKPAREKINLDAGWKFHLGNASDPAKDFNYSVANIYAKSGWAEGTAIQPDFNDSSWQDVQLPHDWVDGLPFAYSPNEDVMSHGYKPVGGLYPENSIGWYRKKFSVAKSDSGKRFAVQLDGIFRDSKIWLNGFYVGNNASGYIGESYDITDFLNYDKENVLVVRVDATQYEGWFYEGAGIYRHVWLNEYNALHFTEDGVFVHTKEEGKASKVEVEIKVASDEPLPARCSVSAYITDRNGLEVAKTGDEAFTLREGGTHALNLSAEVDDPTLWSLENPYLYRLICLLKSGDVVVDSATVRFGIRTVAFDKDKGFFLNGKNIKIQGVCCHQDHAGVGSALPDYLQYYRIRLLKEMGVNAYRTSHNPPTPELLDACDSLGMLVLDENRLLNSSPEYLGQFERLIVRDRNHPSVFLWSIGNEEFHIQTESVGKRIAQTLLAKQMELDPTRTSTYAADVGEKYTGVNEVIPIRGFNYRAEKMDVYHKAHPGQPVVGTEMGSTVTTRGIYAKDTVRCYVPDEDVTAPWWASTAEAWWSIAAARQWCMGGFVWTGFDYRGEPTPYQWPNINSHFGIMDVCGFPKNIYYYYQSWWTDKDVLHISPHWNWKGKEGKPIEVWVNSNAENVELFLNGKSLGKKRMPRNGHLTWSVVYEPGTLEAVALKNGRTIHAKIETTGSPYQIVATADRKILSADGKDADVVNVTVIDKEGRDVPDAQNLIAFSINGDGKILGVGNGDPSSHEPDQCPDGQYRRGLFNGKCQLIFRSGTTPEVLEVRATSEGLQDGIARIQIVK
ncbi:MAG TPA: beta-galactosidase GalA [Bacteroidota bacterium]|nr:beta-galactosidase GalA [Bacteroidota bacterium]